MPKTGRICGNTLIILYADRRIALKINFDEYYIKSCDPQVESSFKILHVNVVIYSNSTNLTWIYFAKKRYKNRLSLLRITADKFSGVRTPKWIITDEEEARTRLKEIAKNGSIVAESVSAEAG